MSVWWVCFSGQTSTSVRFGVAKGQRCVPRVSCPQTDLRCVKHARALNNGVSMRVILVFMTRSVSCVSRLFLIGQSVFVDRIIIDMFRSIDRLEDCDRTTNCNQQLQEISPLRHVKISVGEEKSLATEADHVSSHSDMTICKSIYQRSSGTMLIAVTCFRTHWGSSEYRLRKELLLKTRKQRCDKTFPSGVPKCFFLGPAWVYPARTPDCGFALFPIQANRYGSSRTDRGYIADYPYLKKRND